MTSVIVVGSCNIDLVAYTARLPGAGETVIGERFSTGFGGKGANQAVMAARLGARVAMVGALGDDLYRDMTLATLAGEGIDAAHVARVAGSSGAASIWVEADGTNRIIVVAGANDLVEPAAAARAVAEAAAVDVVVGQLEIPQAATLGAFEAATARSARTVLNPAPATTLDPALLAVTDWLVPNERELELLAGAPIANDDAALAEYATATGVRLVVTLGADGAVVVEHGLATRVPAPTARASDTTGAGDAFVGAFAVGLALGVPAVSAARLGVACASDSVTRPGAQASYPDRGPALELRARIVGSS
jgi:ribokinase